MSWSFCTVVEPVARKSHRCQASLILRDLHDMDVDEHDRITLESLKKDPYVKPGEKYIKVSGIWEGAWCVFKAKRGADILCRKYGMYDDY